MVLKAYNFQEADRSMNCRLLCLLVVASAAASLQSDPNDVRHGLSSVISELSTSIDYFNSPLSLRARNARSQATVFSYAFENSDLQYNLSVDVSGCGYSVKSNTIAGIYTHSNGTVLDEATVRDILEDLKSIEDEAPSAQERQKRLANHTKTLAQSLELSSNELLDNFLICKDSSGVVHDELRHLLWSWSRIEKLFLEHTVLLVSSVAAAGLGGGTIWLGGVYNLSPPKEDPSYLADRKRCTDASMKEDEIDKLLQEATRLERKLNPNSTDWQKAVQRALDLQVRQHDADKSTKLLCSKAASSANATMDKFMTNQQHYNTAMSQARKSAIITATTVFAATLSAGMVNDLAVCRRMRHTEAFPANLYLSMMNRVEQLYRQARAREANQMAVLGSGASSARTIADISSDVSTTWTSLPVTSSSSSSFASSTPSVAAEAPVCLSAEGATGVTQLLPELTSDDTPSTSLTDQIFTELQQAIRREFHTHGACQDIP